MIRHEQNGFVKLLTIILLLLKVCTVGNIPDPSYLSFLCQIPTFFAFGNSLRQRGLQFGGIGHPNVGGPTGRILPQPNQLCDV